MKSAPVTLLNNIAKNVTSFATLITLVRGDGTKLCFTQHDKPITFNGVYFRNDIPYNLSAIDTNSDLSVDTTTLEVAIDGIVFTHRDIGNDLYRGGQIEIALVDWKALDAGKMILRQGWFTQLQDKRPNTLSLEVGGLMKVLDMAIGRTYQPLCDADLGDARCRIALDPAQAYSPYNPYTQGDWAYVWDRSLLTAAGGTNLGFESGASPTGWDTSAGAAWTTPNPITGLLSAEGSRYLVGNTASAAEQFVAQTFDLTAAGVNPADTDDGKIAFVSFVLLAQLGDLTTTYPRIVVESLDANGNILATKDTRYLKLDAPDKWRERCQHVNLRPGTRSVRLYLYGKTKTGTLAKVAFDRVQAYWYNAATTSPAHGLIFKCVRTPNVVQPIYNYGLVNPGFEAANATSDTTENISGWIKAGSVWGVQGTAIGTGGSIPEGLHVLAAGDNGSGVQSTYTITQDFLFSASWVDITRLKQGKYVGRLAGIASYGDTGLSAAGAEIEFFDAGAVSLGIATALTLSTNPTIANVPFLGTFSIPANTVSARIKLTAVSPVGASLAKIGFDSIRFAAYDAERPDAAKDLQTGFGDPNTVFSYAAGTYSQDGTLTWRAFTSWRLTDTVSAVTDRKTFNGTDIVGDYGTYETAKIEWLSGANAGRIGLIRTWFPGTKTIKTYFPQLNPITPGDRYIYYPSCQKRFNEDCVFKFNNGINFQGFPYLPGAVKPDDNTAPLNPNDGVAPSPVKPAFIESTTVPVVTASGTVTYPANLQVGDVMVAVCWNTTSAIPTPPNATWLLAGTFSGVQSGNSCAAGIFYKLVTAQDIMDASAVFTNTTLNSCLSARTSVKPITIKVSSLLTEKGTNSIGTTINLMPRDPKLSNLYVALNGVPTGAVHNDTSNQLDLPITGVTRISYLNMMSPYVTQRALDTAQVVCGYAWTSGPSPARGVRRGGSDSTSIPAILLGLSLGLIGPPEITGG